MKIYRHWFVLLLIVLCVKSAASEVLTVKFPQGPYPQATVSLFRFGSLIYIDLEGFAKALNLRCFVNSERGKLQFATGSIPLKWTADNPFVVIGQEVRQLPAKVVFKESRFWAPLEAFLQIFTQVYPANISVDRKALIVTILPEKSDVYSIQYDEKENGTLVRLLCTRKVSFTPLVLRGNTLTTTLTDVTLDREAIEKISPGGIVEKLEMLQRQGSCQLSFQLRAPILQQSIWQENDTYQVVVSLVTKIVGEKVVERRDVDFDEITGMLVRDQEKWKLDCVVIDPGHGGKDPGAVGATGLQEKEVTLDVALRLQNLLEKVPGLKVILTRKEDRFVGLNERTRLANQKGGKLFISIHCNSLSKGNGAGFETYFLKPARNEKAMEVAMRENSVIKFEESNSEYADLNDENFILLAMAQSQFVRESEALAGIVQGRMRMNTGLKDRGVDQAGFYVLVNASMPAILVESAFISSRGEEKLLRTKKFRQQVAQALYESIVEFQRRTQSSTQDATYMR